MHAAGSAGPAIAPANILITGGTGSLGLQICAHFVRAGAAHITLVSRSGETDETAAALRPLRQSGSTTIRVVAGDIGTPATVARLAELLHDEPLDLVLHAAADYAGVAELQLEAVTVDLAHRVLSSKVIDIENLLDSLPTAGNCHTVLFSSLAATLGGRGKIVYAAANRMLDAYAERARAAGHHCVSVQWGQWAVYRGQNDTDMAQLAAVGYLPMSSSDAISLGLSGIRHNAIVAAFDWDRGHSVLGYYGYGPVLSELVTPALPAATAPVVPVADTGRRVTEILTEVLGADDTGSLDTTRSLVALGLDSLQALEFRRRISSELGYDLEVSDLLGGATADSIVGHLSGAAST
ncbi:beta-ketoacyl reductase [Nocardia carnea]|uniref:beta-ketoacyl reductase n=1 Tax=Nocardia carnea TaxID=37328 RepID=UPI002458743B|nr:beta-ketoacyl reductase [Nocardia carnea]